MRSNREIEVNDESPTGRPDVIVFEYDHARKIESVPRTSMPYFLTSRKSRQIFHKYIICKTKRGILYHALSCACLRCDYAAEVMALCQVLMRLESSYVRRVVDYGEKPPGH